MCLTVYMVCSAGGMVLGGFLAANPSRCERIVGAGFGIAAMTALLIGLGPVPALAVPVLFGIMGFASGIAAPSRTCWSNARRRKIPPAASTASCTRDWTSARPSRP
jgi:MFS family permease